MNPSVHVRSNLPKRLLHFVDGQFVDSADSFPNISPIDGSELSQVVEADKDVVDAAVRAAKRARSGEWGKLNASERADWLHRIADGIQARFDDFVAAEIVIIRSRGRLVTRRAIARPQFWNVNL